jgi:hypothetical protein
VADCKSGLGRQDHIGIEGGIGGGLHSEFRRFAQSWVAKSMTSVVTRAYEESNAVLKQKPGFRSGRRVACSRLPEHVFQFADMLTKT